MAKTTREPFVTYEQAAEILGVHPKTVKGYAKAHGWKVFKIVGKRAHFIPRKDVEALRTPQPVGTSAS